MTFLLARLLGGLLFKSLEGLLSLVLQAANFSDAAMQQQDPCCRVMQALWFEPRAALC
jgi:hypothetical protein